MIFFLCSFLPIAAERNQRVPLKRGECPNFSPEKFVFANENNGRPSPLLRNTPLREFASKLIY